MPLDKEGIVERLVDDYIAVGERIVPTQTIIDSGDVPGLADDYETQCRFFESGNDEGLIAYLEKTQPGIKEKDYL